ncbi:MAG: sugar ABC transporter permease, partial [Chloroflexi bacterium]|nr:sugar ABC transporter permease [Chloroflexota bacterium]
MVASRRGEVLAGRAQPAVHPALHQAEERAAAFFLAPGLFGVLAFIAFPVIFSFAISLTRWDIIGRPEFVGTANYLHLLGDAQFHHYLRNTFIYAGSV